ncbi:MAG: sugar phosphate isomerase/epimerase [Fimbriimonadaceae bacterium]|nr:sugar phosphate isomerase/epimerase [Fimbriimonadaceae bacterium]QYK55359.1 MAG: sugar phosphate isomerase/epimerase [Fimbriimonadaceae bacterium]
MSRADHQDIRIGTLVPMRGAADYIRQVLPHGFETFQLTLGKSLDGIDLERTAHEVRGALEGKAAVSALGFYGNPLQDEECRTGWEAVIKAAPLFGTDCVCGFAGALEDRPVDQSIPRFKEVFAPLARLAEDSGVRIGFENCHMGGDWERPKWNIAHAPRAWEMMFDAVPSPALGLEWEPCHQMVSLVDPLTQLKTWVGKVAHVHGKDANVDWDKIRREGTRCGEYTVWHRTPGFGDTDWTQVFSILRQAGWRGSIDIEGWHDPVYRGDLEMTGQVHALAYLKRCRGGDFVPNPRV